MSSEFEKFYLSQKKEGLTDEEVIEILVKNGWERTDAVREVNKQKKEKSGSSNNKIFLYLFILLIVLITVSFTYWFLIRENNVDNEQHENILVNEEINTNNITISNVNGNLGPFIKVYDYEISKSYYDYCRELLSRNSDYLDGVISSSIWNAPESLSIVYYNLENALASYLMDDLDIEYTSRDEFIEDIKELKNSNSVEWQEEWQNLQKQNSWDFDEYLNHVYYDYQFWMSAMLESKIGNNAISLYDDLTYSRVQKIYNSFAKRLPVIKDPENAFVHEYGIVFFNKGSGLNQVPPFQSNSFFIEPSFVEDINEWPDDFKNQLISLQDKPLELTDIVKSEDGFYYFGFVLPNSPTSDQSKLSVEHIAGARYPGVSENGYLQTAFYLDILLENGINNRSIQMLDESIITQEDLEKFIDYDEDGLPNYYEHAFGSDMTLVDTDEDGLTDKEEYDAGTNPNKIN